MEAGDITEIMNINQKLNAFTLIEFLRVYIFEEGHSAVVNRKWNQTLLLLRSTDELKNRGLLQNLESTFIVSQRTHAVKAHKSDYAQLTGVASECDFSKPNLISNALGSLRQFKSDPLKVLNNCQMLNRLCGAQSKKDVLKEAKRMSFSPDLEQIFKLYGSDSEKELSKQVNSLYINLGRNRNDLLVKNLINENLLDLEVGLKQKDLKLCNSSIGKLFPYLKSEVMAENFDKSHILRYVFRTL